MNALAHNATSAGSGLDLHNNDIGANGARASTLITTAEVAMQWTSVRT